MKRNPHFARQLWAKRQRADKDPGAAAAAAAAAAARRALESHTRDEELDGAAPEGQEALREHAVVLPRHALRPAMDLAVFGDDDGGDDPLDTDTAWYGAAATQPISLSGMNADGGGGGGGGSAKSHEDAIADLFPQDYSRLELKPNAASRPIWVCHDGRIILEAFSPLVNQAQDFLITIAEPVTRPSRIHEYKLTAYSLYAAVSVGMTTDVILDVLERFSKVKVPDRVVNFIKECTLSYGKVKLVLNRNRYFIESSYPEILRILLNSPEILAARIIRTEEEEAALLEQAKKDKASADASKQQQTQPQHQQQQQQQKAVKSEDADAEFGAVITLDREDDDDDADAVAAAAASRGINGTSQVLDDESDFTQSFEINPQKVEEVKRKCTELDYPLMEEYDFRHDDINETLDIDLSPKTTIRDYQEKCLSKMFGGGASGGRARSGIIVLPTGAGKTLVGITAACTVKKSTLVLCTNALSVEQWSNEFRKWSTLQDHQIAKFTAESKQQFAGNSGVVISTYTMISHTGRRAYDTQKMLEFVNGHEWGLMILDEVHVVPANIFRRVLTTVAAHTKLGLTATLVREDDKIEDLNFLIGPKLYEANWMDLATRGHIAKVEATEIWCPMTGDFYQEYLKSNSGKRRLLCVMNPSKFMACEYLIRWREKQGDKIIVFSDNVFALMYYAMELKKPFIYGETPHEERSKLLNMFRNNHPQFRTIFLSKVGDTSLDLPEATCLIQISSQFGSRRQEAQRMGRILRAKRRNEAGFRSRFYTLVSKDTDEVVFSARRRKFLVDQGYEFKIVPSFEALVPEEERSALRFNTPADQARMLKLVKEQRDEVGLEETVRTSADDIEGAWMNQPPTAAKRGAAARRAAAAAAAVAAGLPAPQQPTRAAAVPPRRTHKLFKAWQRGK
ncbi:DNA repair helicase RAD25 [Polyrhizophydium stewartii]|uniref:DNA 3'-5' helicase n=1 Tax=Polyrhizophydium stewartii TaxID=2732419 RepID=A0ABR4NE48_9FUNG